MPRKNARLLGGKPLIVYSIEAALSSQQLAAVVVSTDDTEIADIARQAGAEVPFMRPAELATDNAPTLGVVQHTLTTLAEQGRHFDAVCLLQPTVPFRSAADIDAAVAKFAASDADSVVSMREVPHQFNPHWTFEENDASGTLRIATGDAALITRRQNLPAAWYRDGAIYCTTSTVVLHQNSLYGKRMIGYQCQQSPNINIDTEADWLAAENWLQQHGG